MYFPSKPVLQSAQEDRRQFSKGRTPVNKIYLITQTVCRLLGFWTRLFYYLFVTLSLSTCPASSLPLRGLFRHAFLFITISGRRTARLLIMSRTKNEKNQNYHNDLDKISIFWVYQKGYCNKATRFTCQSYKRRKSNNQTKCSRFRTTVFRANNEINYIF